MIVFILIFASLTSSVFAIDLKISTNVNRITPPIVEDLDDSTVSFTLVEPQRLDGNWNMLEGTLTYCPQVALDPQMLTNLADQINGKCLPTAAEARGFVAGDMNRDSNICRCLRSERGTTFTGALFESFVPPNIQQTQINNNIARMNRLIQARQNAMLFHASVLSTNPERAGLLTRRYGVSFARNENLMDKLNDANRSTSQIFNRRQQNGQTSLAMTPLVFTRPDRSLLDSMATNSCLSMRDFMAFSQLSENATVYNYLAVTPSFVQDEWDYQKLSSNFASLTHGFPNLTVALNDQGPHASAIQQTYEKMRFLQKNPLYKNFFLSRAPAADKTRLFQILKTNLTGRTADVSGLRRSTDEFFADDKIRDFTTESLRKETSDFLRSIPGRVTDTSSPIDLTRAWSDAITNIRSESQTEVPEAPTPVEIYGKYCPALEARLSQVGSTVLNELEDTFASDFDANASTNKEFAQMTDAICNRPRLGPVGKESITFSRYQGAQCGGLVHSSCLRQFLLAYPRSTGEVPEKMDELIAIGLVPTLDPDHRVADLRTQSEGIISATSSPDSWRSGGNAISRGIEQINEGISNSVNAVTNTISKSVKAVTDAFSAPPTTTNSALGSVLPGEPNLAAVPVIVPSETSPVDNLRKEVREGNADVTRIRDEISSLRDFMQRDPAGADRDSQGPDLAARMALLEARLTEAQRDRDQAQTALQRFENRSTSGSDTPRDDNSPAPVNSVSPQSVVNSDGAVAPQGGAQDRAFASAGSGGGTSAGASSPSGAAVPLGLPQERTYSTTANSALLAKYGMQVLASQGSITVAEAGTGTDVQRLIDDSQGSVIPISVSSDEFSLIEANNEAAIQRYLERVRSMPGEVVRLALTGPDNRSLEVFFLKSGSQISIVKSPNAARGIASEGRNVPVIEARTNTLRNLRQELGN